MASGIQEFTRTGSTSKIIHGGWGAHSGIIAVDMAQAGITGPESVFEGRIGFFQTHLMPITGELDCDPLVGGPRQPLVPAGDRVQALSLLPAPARLHRGGQADPGPRWPRTALQSTRSPRSRCKLAEPGLTLVTEPRERKKAPRLRMRRRFSLPFVVANAMITGDIGLHSFDEAHMADPEIAASRTPGVRRRGSGVRLPRALPGLAGGRRRRQDVCRPCPLPPRLVPRRRCETDDVLDKFARNTGWLFGDGARDVGAALARPLRDRAAWARSLPRSTGQRRGAGRTRGPPRE